MNSHVNQLCDGDVASAMNDRAVGDGLGHVSAEAWAGSTYEKGNDLCPAISW